MYNLKRFGQCLLLLHIITSKIISSSAHIQSSTIMAINLEKLWNGSSPILFPVLHTVHDNHISRLNDPIPTTSKWSAVWSDWTTRSWPRRGGRRGWSWNNCSSTGPGRNRRWRTGEWNWRNLVCTCHGFRSIPEGFCSIPHTSYCRCFSCNTITMLQRKCLPLYKEMFT